MVQIAASRALKVRRIATGPHKSAGHYLSTFRCKVQAAFGNLISALLRCESRRLGERPDVVVSWYRRASLRWHIAARRYAGRRDWLDGTLITATSGCPRVAIASAAAGNDWQGKIVHLIVF